MRIIADDSSQRDVEKKWQRFQDEPKKIRLSLAMDGVNTFSNQSTPWSTWPTVAINNNFPPCMSMKKEHVMLTLIILGTI